MQNKNITYTAERKFTQGQIEELYPFIEYRASIRSSFIRLFCILPMCLRRGTEIGWWGWSEDWMMVA